MKGKKTDLDFIAKFVQESVQLGMETTEQIVSLAKERIQTIDEEIKSINSKKILRSKLLDVVYSFENIKDNLQKRQDSKILSFFALQYPDRCKLICKLINEKKSLDLNVKLSGALSLDKETMFSIKQLIDQQIIIRRNDFLISGDRFEEYMRNNVY